MGLTYRGKHSYRDIGVHTAVRSRPVSPPPKTSYNENIPYMDGSLDFSETGGRVYYKDKTLEVDFTIIARNRKERNRTAERFAAWISGGKSELILDDMPLVKWIAAPVTIDDIALSLKRLGTVTVEFRCQPFNQFIFNTAEGIILDSNIPIGSDIPLAWAVDCEKEIPAGESEWMFDNTGSAYVRPTIELVGNLTYASVWVNTQVHGKVETYKITYTGAVENLVIDCERFMCRNGEGEDVTANSSGEFFEIPPGLEIINVDVSHACTLRIGFHPLFFYDADL